MDYCAYSLLKEGSNQCDYEIMTDRLASFLGLSMHYIKHIDQEELLFLCETIYHANGSIRGKNAIDDIRFQKVEQIYRKYERPFKEFYLPVGCIGASYLHVLRSECKNIVRWIVKIEKENKWIKRSMICLIYWQICSFIWLYMKMNKRGLKKRCLYLSHTRLFYDNT